MLDRRAAKCAPLLRHFLGARACNRPRQPIFSFFDGAVSICAIRLTNFFDLSNIRVEPWGAGEMLGASRWSRNMPFQFDGQPALGAALLFARDFSTPPKMFCRSSEPLAGVCVGRAPLVLRCNPGRRFQSCRVRKNVTCPNHEGAKTGDLAGKRNSGGRSGGRARISSSR